jgi:hypothetical protein
MVNPGCSAVISANFRKIFFEYETAVRTRT